MSEAIDFTISQRICQHMNEYHANAVVLYAQVFGDCPEAEAARMLAIDPEGMDLAVEVAGETENLRINFEHPLKDAQDAHHTLIAMVKEARQGQR